MNVLAISIVALTPTIARGVLAGFILLVAAESAISPVRVLLVSRAQTTLGRATRVRLFTLPV
jgi:hypothetical protein